ncbi:hypothetical protein [Bacillus horti]|uniref:Membrane protein YesL n=1 Tax=Caldalkalibacillus horti TaxID=77523 RepID=A0ABT9VTL8_9BACI|nr:hypothetical protein [Bacillus horti]MDQ0164313.1 putative membrane protein YesL [Bacillus horti]
MGSLTHVLRMAVKEFYQHIVLLVLLSLLCVVILSPSFFLIPIPYSFVYIVLLLGPLQMVLTYSNQQALEGEKVGIKVFFKGLKTYFWGGLCFSVAASFFIFIVISSWWYWGQTESYPTFVLACFQTYFVSMILVSQIYTIPLYVKYKHSLKESMLLSLKLLIKYPLYTLGAFIQILSLGVLLALTVVGFLFLFPGVYTVLSHLLTANIVSRFDPSQDTELTLSSSEN